MAETPQFTEREVRIARVLRSLGKEPLTRQQVETAAKLLGVHRSTVYRLRKRFLQRSLTSAVAPKPPGQNPGSKRLDTRVERVIQLVLSDWLPRQRQLAHPLLDICMEVWRCCHLAEVAPPGRNTVSRRWAAHREAQAAVLANDPAALVAPGSFGAAAPLDIVQIDHTQADVFLVDEWFHRSMGRPWLSVAIDLATRGVVGIYVGMERPNAATVALLLSRVALPKAPWLASIGSSEDVAWPMHGLPKVLHLDNAAEFHSRALRMGCSEYGPMRWIRVSMLRRCRNFDDVLRHVRQHDDKVRQRQIQARSHDKWTQSHD